MLCTISNGMEMLVTIGLISVVTLAVSVVNKLLSFRVCPVCAGVSLTWLLMTAGILTGQLLITDYQLPLAILIGGTVVGVSNKNKNKLKAPIVLSGFLLVYYALNYLNWTIFWVEVAVLVLIMYAYFIVPDKKLKIGDNPVKVKEIEEKLKNCC